MRDKVFNDKCAGMKENTEHHPIQMSIQQSNNTINAKDPIHP